MGALPVTKVPARVNPRAVAKIVDKKEKSQVSTDDLYVDSDEAPDVRDSRNALILTIDSKIDFLQNTTDLCCATLNSKIDALDFQSVECCATLNSKLDNLDVSTSKIDFDLNSCCVTLNSKLDMLLIENQCDATPIIAGTTITTPGVYCLVQDITSISLMATIRIMSDDVILDLNGHRLSNNSGTGAGIQVDAFNNTVIRNGFLQANTNSASSNAIYLLGSHNVKVENVIVGSSSVSPNWGFGLQLQAADSVLVVDSQFHNNNTNGIALVSTNNVHVERCLINNNGSDGFFVTGSVPNAISSEIYIVNCQLNHNFSNGLAMNSGSSSVHALNCAFSSNGADGVDVAGCSCLEFINCSVDRSETLDKTEEGFDIDTCSNVLIKDCSACGFDDGFLGTSVVAFNIVNSIAKNNHVGFNLLGAGGSAIVQGCTADNNTNTLPLVGVGFNDDGLGNNQYYSNKACANDSNYSPTITSAPVTSPANARGVMNVDCSITTTDQVIVIESKLDLCCFTLNSKVDDLGVASSKIDADLLNCCFTLSSKIDFLDFVDLADCCATINSKIDVVISIGSKTDSDLNNCCFTLGSKIDFLDFVELANCCNTLNSKVDVVQETEQTILSHIDGVQDSLNACCFTLSSQIDFLDVVDLRPCCFTIESKIDLISASVSKIDEDLLDCCSTLNSKVDFVAVLDTTILSHVDGVQDSLNACCFTLSSQIDFLDVVDLRPCCFTIESKVDVISASASKIDADLSACCSTLNSKVDVVVALDNTILSHVDGVQNSLNVCCFTLGSKIDELDFVDLANCCSTLNSKIDELTTIVVDDFAGTFTVLNTILGEAASVSSIDQCCATLSSKIDDLANLVNADFAALLAQEITTQSKVDLCCSTLNSKIDSLTTVVVDDFAGTFTVLNSILAEAASVSSIDECCATLVSKIDELQGDVSECCYTLESKVDSVQRTDSSILSRVDALSVTVEADFAGTFTVLADISGEAAVIESKVDNVQVTDNAVLSKLDACCFDLSSQVDSLAIDNFALTSKLDTCCFGLDSKIQFLIDFVLIP